MRMFGPVRQVGAPKFGPEGECIEIRWFSCYNETMIVEYINAALEKARFEKIADRNPYYAEIPGLKGVWATGKSQADCRRRLAETLEGWIIVRLRRGLDLPRVNGISLKAAARMPVHA